MSLTRSNGAQDAPQPLAVKAAYGFGEFLPGLSSAQREFRSDTLEPHSGRAQTSDSKGGLWVRGIPARLKQCTARDPQPLWLISCASSGIFLIFLTFLIYS